MTIIYYYCEDYYFTCNEFDSKTWKCKFCQQEITGYSLLDHFIFIYNPNEPKEYINKSICKKNINFIQNNIKDYKF